MSKNCASSGISVRPPIDASPRPVIPSLVERRTKIQAVRLVARTTVVSMPVIRTPSSAWPIGSPVRAGAGVAAASTAAATPARVGSVERNVRRPQGVIIETRSPVSGSSSRAGR